MNQYLEGILSRERYLARLYEDLTYEIKFAEGRRCSEEYIEALKKKRYDLAERPLEEIRKKIKEITDV